VTPPILESSQPQGNIISPQVPNIDGSSSPPIPAKNNIRHRVELDSVSPGVQRPNPMEDTVSPITPTSPSRANFSYPARAPPQGVPRQVPANGMPPQQQHMDQQQPGIPPVPPVPEQQHRRSSIPQLPAQQQQQAGMPPPMPNQQPPSLQPGFNPNDPNRPIPYRAGHDLNKQGTMANLKAAAAGIHVSLHHLQTHLQDTKLTPRSGRRRNPPRNIQRHLRPPQPHCARKEPSRHRQRSFRN
jgi:hypothetical protein